MIDMPDKNTIRKMTDKELRSLLEEAQEEFDRREREARERDWFTVREAIADFVMKWGRIDMLGNYAAISIDKGVDMDSIGEIDMSD